MGFLKNLFLSSKAKRHALVGAPQYWKLKQQFQFDFLKRRGLKPHQSLLDIGCGTLRGGIPLIDYLEEGKYTGIEIRESALEEGRKELKEEKLEHKKPILICFDDFGNLNLDTKYDVMLAFSVLFHLEDSIAAACFNFIGRHLADDGVFYGNINRDSGKQGKWLEFPVMHHEVSFYENLCQENGLRLKSIGKLKDLGHHTGVESQDNQVMLEIRKA